MNDHDRELIDRYLSGEMSPEAQQAFDDRLRTEPALQEALQNRAAAQDALHGSEAPQPAMPNNKGLFLARSKVVRLQRFSIAVASLAVVLALLLFLAPWKPDLTTKYAAQKMEHPTEQAEVTDSSLHHAIEQFNHRHYAAAITHLTAVLVQRPDDAYARLYRGVAYLENGRPALSRPDLEMVYNGTSSFKYEGAFYLALGYLKEKNKQKCREWLMKIPEDAVNYHRAQQLLAEL